MQGRGEKNTEGVAYSHPLLHPPSPGRAETRRFPVARAGRDRLCAQGYVEDFFEPRTTQMAPSPSP